MKSDFSASSTEESWVIYDVFIVVWSVGLGQQPSTQGSRLLTVGQGGNKKSKSSGDNDRVEVKMERSFTS